MSRRLVENAVVIFGFLVLLGLFAGAVALVFFWHPSSPVVGGSVVLETADAKRARCAAAPSEVVVLSRARVLPLAEGESLASAARAEVITVGDPPKMRGYRLTEIAPGSLYELAGLCASDEVLAIGGQALDSEEVALELFEKLRDADRIRVDLMRSARPYITTIELR